MGVHPGLALPPKLLAHKYALHTDCALEQKVKAKDATQWPGCLMRGGGSGLQRLMAKLRSPTKPKPELHSC